jgi:hypothetical protein
MYYIDDCLICGSKKVDAFSCKTAPFLSERVWQSEPQKIKLLRCNICQFAFYNVRLENEEIAKLYKDYRGEVYQRERQRLEKSYSREYNYNLGHNDDEIRRRKNNLFALLRKYSGKTHFTNVLDYGGDHGQYIPDELSDSDKYVFEISGIKPLKGIRLITEMREAEKYAFDLIMCSHVLEHVSSPRSDVEKLIRCAHEKSIFYFEVPVELVNFLKISEFIQSMNFRQYPTRENLWTTIMTSLRKFPLYCLLSNQRFFNSLFPVFDILGLKFFSMHEHCNFFNVHSMKALVESCGLEVLHVDAVSLNPGEVISCLAKMKKCRS